MPALAKNQSLPLLAAIAAAISIGGAVVIKYLLKFLARRAALNKRRQARLALTSRPASATAPKLQYVVFYALPDLKDGSEVHKKLLAITDKMNSAFPCLSLALSSYGSNAMGKQALLSFLGKPDMSCYMTHSLFIAADDTMALKLFLHSNLHKGEWYATGGPYARGLLEMSCDLGIDLNPKGKEDPLLQIVFLRFKPEVTDDSDIYNTFQKAVAELSKCPGIAAALRPAGYDKLIKEDLVAEIQWNDNSYLGSHCLTVAADSPQHLKDLQNSEPYGYWLKTEMPYLVQQDGIPPAVIFYCPLKVTAAC